MTHDEPIPRTPESDNTVMPKVPVYNLPKPSTPPTRMIVCCAGKKLSEADRIALEKYIEMRRNRALKNKKSR